MGYSDQKYFSFDLDKIATAIAFGTATATAGTYAVPSTNVMPVYKNQTTAITGFEVVAASAPNNKLTGVFQVLNGTNTIITGALGTASAAGGYVYGSYTGTYTATGTATADKVGSVPANVFTSTNTLIFNFVGTATASGDATGTWDLYVNDGAHV